MLFLSFRAQTRDPRSGGNVRAGLQRVPGRVDSRLRGNDKWGDGSLSIAVVRGALVLSSRAQTRDPRSSGSVRAGLQRVPGRVDSRLRGNDKKGSSSRATRNAFPVIPGVAQCFFRHPGRRAMLFPSSRAQTRDPRSGSTVRAGLNRDPTCGQGNASGHRLLL